MRRNPFTKRKLILNKTYKEPDPIPGAKFVQLGHNKFAIVDEEDFDILDSYHWTIHAKEYATNNLCGLMHRFITNPKDDLDTDHINGNTLDNRKVNLRHCTNQQNSQNRKKTGSSSKFKGVCLHKKNKKWLASIGHTGEKYYLGYFVSEQEAAEAYDKKAIELFGEFALTNKMLGLYDI